MAAWIPRSAGLQLPDGVGSLQDLDLGLDGSFSNVPGPQHHLGRFDVVGDVEVSDGTATALGESSLYGGLGRGIKYLLGGGPGFFHAQGVGYLGTEFDGEFVAPGGGDFEGLGSWLELEHGAEGDHVSVLAFDVDQVDATDGSYPLWVVFGIVVIGIVSLVLIVSSIII